MRTLSPLPPLKYPFFICQKKSTGWHKMTDFWQLQGFCKNYKSSFHILVFPPTDRINRRVALKANLGALWVLKFLAKKKNRAFLCLLFSTSFFLSFSFINSPSCQCRFWWTFTQKWQLLSFTQLHVFINLYESLSSTEHRRCFQEPNSWQ